MVHYRVFVPYLLQLSSFAFIKFVQEALWIYYGEYSVVMFLVHEGCKTSCDYNKRINLISVLVQIRTWRCYLGSKPLTNICQQSFTFKYFE